MINHPKVSVILTSYNHAKYLHESIDSVLDQTFNNFELIIWDDASTDESWEIINSYSDPRLRSYQSKSPNIISNLKEAISDIVVGEYIAIHHSDDVWEPDKLEKQVAFLDTNPSIGAVFSRAQIIDQDGQPFQDQDHPYCKVFEQPNRTRHEWLNYFFNNGNALCHPSLLIRKVCYAECGVYREGFAQLPDLDMWVRLCMKYEIYVFPEKLIRFRVHNNEANSSGNRPEVHIRSQFEYFQILDHYRKYLTFQDLVKVFPEAEKYLTPDGSDFDFALGMLALDAKPYKSKELFGLNILFEALNDPVHAQKIDTLYGFKNTDFISLTAQHDAFSTGKVLALVAQVQALDAQVAELTLQTAELAKHLAEQDNHITNLTAQLEAVYSSRSWRITAPIREVNAKLRQLRHRDPAAIDPHDLDKS